MPYMQRRRFHSGPRPTINSEKNIVNLTLAGTGGTQVIANLALAVDSADNTVVTQVTRRCKIFKLWVEIWASATALVAEGVTTTFDAYIIKNPGANLTNPGATVVGSSNEKKFVFKQWKGLVGSRKEGFPAYSWKGWIKVPKVYQRMGTDDVLQLVFLFAGVNGLLCGNIIYKWYT